MSKELPVQEVFDLVVKAFLDGGLWADQFKVWNEGKSTRELEQALRERGQTYAIDLLRD